MRNLRQLDQYRNHAGEQTMSGGWPFPPEGCGVFEVPSLIDGEALRCIASDGDHWDHVSVSREDRCPNWEEMGFIYRMFFRPDEVAMQLHVPPEAHINYHPYCLHLWRPNGLKQIPVPPSWMVGPKVGGQNDATKRHYGRAVGGKSRVK